MYAIKQYSKCYQVTSVLCDYEPAFNVIFIGGLNIECALRITDNEHLKLFQNCCMHRSLTKGIH